MKTKKEQIHKKLKKETLKSSKNACNFKVLDNIKKKKENKKEKLPFICNMYRSFNGYREVINDTLALCYLPHTIRGSGLKLAAYKSNV